MAYPSLPSDPSQHYLRDHFELTTADQEFLGCAQSDSHRLGLAVLLKTYQVLGYAPELKDAVPSGIVDWIAQRLEVSATRFAQYPWSGRTGRRTGRHHLALVRAYLDVRPFEPADAANLQDHLVLTAKESPSRSFLLGPAAR